MVADGVAALVSHQVDLHETRSRVVPLSPRADRNLRLQQRPRLGQRPAFESVLGPLIGQATVDRGSRHGYQQLGGIVGDLQLAEPTQGRHESGQHRREPLTRRHAQHRPTKHQRCNDIRAVRRWARRARPHDPGSQRGTQRLAGVIAMPTRRCTQLVQDQTLARPVRPHVAGRDRLRHSLALTQRQLHHPAVAQPSPTSLNDTPHAGILK